MCGIAGIVRITPAGEGAKAALARSMFEAIPEQWLDVLDAGIRHRGPDGQGRFRDRAVRADGCVVDVALVHRRLSIIDHACGAQPMVSLRGPVRDPSGSSGGGGSHPPLLFHGKPNDAVNYQPLPVREGDNLVATVFNGCIYNHRELRAELQAAGHRFETDHSDTEVLLHGWREWGATACSRWAGMFACAIWDRSTGSLALSRDSFGEKPLHLMHVYREKAWINVFASIPPAASELTSLIGSPEQKIDPESGAQLWLRFGTAPDAPLPLARTVHPGMTVVYEPIQPLSSTGGAEAQAPPPTALINHMLSDGQRFRLPRRDTPLTAEHVDELLSAAVKDRLEADVPVGCFLSGGVDSSLISLMAKRHRADIRTFTVRMPVPEYDESAHAERVAKIIGTDHLTLACEPRPAEDLVYLVRQVALPFGDSSLLPAYWLSKAARQHVKVALSGDGGDELFGGYQRYQISKWTPAGLFGAARVGLWLGRTIDPKSLRAKVARWFDAAGNRGYLDLLSIFPSSMLDKLLTGEALERDRLSRLAFPDSVSTARAMSLDLFNYLPEDLMRKSDSASMSVGLEVRSPFLAPEVVRAAVSAPLSTLMPRGQRKGLLRQVARKYLPADIVDRPKQGFAIPIGEWFRSDYGGLRTLLLDRLNSAEPFGPPSLGIDLNMAFVRQMLDEHLGTGPSGLVKRDHSQRLYMLLVLSIWADWMGRLGRTEPRP